MKRRGLSAFMALTFAAGITTVVVTAGGAAQATTSSGSSTAYRHGVVPPLGSQAAAAPSARARTASTTPGPNDMAFGGGIQNVGVTTGAPRVYLVLDGSQWGTQGTTTLGGNTYASFSGDPHGMAPDLQAFLSGLGTGSGATQDLWSGVMTQYCEGVAAGTFFCPATSSHEAYPTGGALAGVWEDTGHSAPLSPTATQLAQEAETAATHFGNTTQASNRDTQYFILSPTGTHPDGFNTITGQFCAWHDYTGDGYGISQPDGTVAFTNMPYVTDMGTSCGQDFVNSGSAGTLDGVTIVGGHEYAETVTDQFPAGGWTVPSGSAGGEENGDLCAWISSGQGAAANLSLTTGSFAVQSTWANDFNGGSGGCELSHPIVTNASTNTVTVNNPGPQTSTQGTPISNLTMTANDSASGQTFTFSASGLPAGLTITPSGSSAGVISGNPSSAVLNASVTITATDTTGASGNTSFTWTVNSSGGNTVTVTNPGSQSSTLNKAIPPLQVHASDSQANQVFTYSALGLPGGLSINSTTGVITGTPSATGTSNPSVTVTDNTGAHGSASFTWTVSAVPNTVTVKNPGNQSTRVNNNVSLHINATDSQGGQSVTFVATNLPPGLTMAKTGSLQATVSGRPNKTGTYSVTITATDTTGAHGSTSFTWSIRLFSGKGSSTNTGTPPNQSGVRRT